MAQQKFHIKEDGTIQKCSPFKSCRRDHWGSFESARIHLDNIAYKAEVAVKLREFESARMNVNNGYFIAGFSAVKGQNKAPRSFREKIDAYVAHHGQKPKYLKSVMRESLGHWEDYKKKDVYFTVVSVPQMDSVHAELSYEWYVKSVLHDGSTYRKDETVLFKSELDFSNSDEREYSTKVLKDAYRTALKATGHHHIADEDYEPFMPPMLERVQEMVSAVETVRHGEFWAFHKGLGDFVEGNDDTINVDVIYDKSILTGQSVERFIRDCKTHGYTWVKDLNLRVADRTVGHPRSSWVLNRADGIWTVEVLNFAGEGYTVVVQDAEDIRSHIYWHIMREYYPADQQELALKHADYAEQIFLSVEAAVASLTS